MTDIVAWRYRLKSEGPNATWSPQNHEPQKSGDKEIQALALQSRVEELREALTSVSDSIAFLLNNVTMTDNWYDKFSRELKAARAVIGGSNG